MQWSCARTSLFVPLLCVAGASANHSNEVRFGSQDHSYWHNCPIELLSRSRHCSSCMQNWSRVCLDKINGISSRIQHVCVHLFGESVSMCPCLSAAHVRRVWESSSFCHCLSLISSRWRRSPEDWEASKLWPSLAVVFFFLSREDLPVHRDIFYLLARFVWKSSNR